MMSPDDGVTEEDFSKLPGGASPRWVSGEKYDRAYATANHLSRRVAALTEAILAIDYARDNDIPLSDIISVTGHQDLRKIMGCRFDVPDAPVVRFVSIPGSQMRGLADIEDELMRQGWKGHN